MSIPASEAAEWSN